VSFLQCHSPQSLPAKIIDLKLLGTTNREQLEKLGSCLRLILTQASLTVQFGVSLKQCFSQSN